MVIGGSASGKSEFAEEQACFLAKRSKTNLIYLATLNPASGGDTDKRIEKHRKSREGKGFSTIEWTNCRQIPEIPEKSTVLLEDLGNLCANALFPPDCDDERNKLSNEEILNLILQVSQKARHTVFVANDIFGQNQNLSLSIETKEYVETMRFLTDRLLKVCKSFQVIAGVPVKIKGGLWSF